MSGGTHLLPPPGEAVGMWALGSLRCHRCRNLNDACCLFFREIFFFMKIFREVIDSFNTIIVFGCLRDCLVLFTHVQDMKRRKYHTEQKTRWTRNRQENQERECFLKSPILCFFMKPPRGDSRVCSPTMSFDEYQ